MFPDDPILKVLKVEGRGGPFTVDITDLGRGLFSVRIDDERNSEFWLDLRIQIDLPRDSLKQTESK